MGPSLFVGSSRPGSLYAPLLTATGNTKHRGLVTPLLVDTSDKELPFQFRQLQFQIKLAYAMTTNKAQGQILRFMDLYLNGPVLSCGQLYVALSRVSSEDKVIIVSPDAWETSQKRVTHAAQHL